MLTMPDLTEPLDLAIVALLAFLIPVVPLANRVNLPFLTRDGGLLTYGKFAQGVTYLAALAPRHAAPLRACGGHRRFHAERYVRAR